MDKSGQIHFVGSIAGDSAEDVFSMCGESVGNLVATMPDGETGSRSQYVRFLADTIYSKHPNIVAVKQPMPIDTDTQAGEEGFPDEEDSSNMQKFRLREGVTELEFDVLGYGDAAVESYQVYAKLRGQGVIPKDVRFQVSLPNAIDGSMPMLADLNDLPIFVSAYEKAMAKDIRIINENIPASDLAFQWDNVCSVLEHEMAPTTPDQSPAQSHSPTERFRELFSRFQQNIPDEIPLGIIFVMAMPGIST